LENLSLKTLYSGSVKYFIYQRDANQSQWEKYVTLDYQAAKEKDEAYWIDLIQLILKGEPRVLVKSLPDKELK